MRKVNARVVLKGEDTTDMETMPLLRVVRATGKEAGKPRQEPDFVPPSMLLRSSPVLHDQMRELVAQLNASREQFRVKVASGGLGLVLVIAGYLLLWIGAAREYLRGVGAARPAVAAAGV